MGNNETGIRRIAFLDGQGTVYVWASIMGKCVQQAHCTILSYNAYAVMDLGGGPAPPYF